jgi:hypothetical protein
MEGVLLEKILRQEVAEEDGKENGRSQNDHFLKPDLMIHKGALDYRLHQSCSLGA